MPLSDEEAIRRVSDADVEAYGEELGLSLTAEEVADYRELVNGTLAVFDDVAEYSGPTFPHETRTYAERPSGHRPSDADDPLNAWLLRCRVTGAESGPLSDLEVGLKDSIALGGYPMTLGSELLTSFVPTLDATVVRRLLDAGATIVGKQNMESFAFSGSGDTSDFGPVGNPYSDDHLAGGSSSGSAAAVAAGDCDVSIGSDQMGSVRIPSACCGTVGLKPTTGLVPYTGAFPLDLGIDHLGPIAASVEPVARTLEVIAGEDVVDGLRLDPRQPRGVSADEYTAHVGEGIDDLTIGVLEEGFGWEFGHEEIDEAVRAGVDVLAAEGATVETVSMETHRLLSSAAAVVATIGGARTLMDAGLCRGADGWYWTQLVDALDAFVDARADNLPPSVKQALLTAIHVTETDGIDSYGMAQNIALEAEQRYNQLLADRDALVMPTIVVPPMELDPALDRVSATSREALLGANTAASDLTGHPALTVPCAMRDGLPVGMMLVGSHFDESTILRAAAAFEAATDWTTM